jgi:hypothetical protein
MLCADGRNMFLTLSRIEDHSQDRENRIILENM